MTVYAATQAELATLGEAAEASVEGQRALALAAALDDRAGVQAGGLASTDKRLGELLAEIRESYRPVVQSGLTLLRSDGVA